jgi:hypothetical protein
MPSRVLGIQGLVSKDTAITFISDAEIHLRIARIFKDYDS